MSKKNPWYKSEWLQNFKTVILIVLGILLIGLLINLHSKKSKLNEENLSKEDYLKKINKRISELEKLKEEFELKLKKIMFRARIIISILVIVLNVCYYLFWGDFSQDFIGPIVNFNSFFLLLYSFLAFLSYGTIDKFKAKLEVIIKLSFGTSQIASVFELNMLKKERDKVLNDLKSN